MTSRRSFGVGCFHFSIKRKPPFKFKVSEYIGEVKLFLQAVPNVTNIEIENDDNEALIEVTNTLPSLNTDVFPLLNFLSIHFDISIPLQIQKELTETIFAFPLTAFVERFRVYIVHTFYSPVTFIETIDMHSQNYEPSKSVIAVREYLKSQSAKRQSGFIEFQALGPSPFHAEFFVEEPDSHGEEVPWVFWNEKLNMKGYDHITFYFDRERFEDIEEAKLFIMDEIQDEFGFFYQLKQAENKKENAWLEIMEKLDGIIEIQKSRGLRAFSKRYRSFRQLNEVFLSIIQFESNSIFQNDSMQSEYRDIYTDDPSLSLKDYVDKEISDRRSFPTTQLMELIKLFQSQREKLSESLMVLIAAILGGIVGSLLTILFS